MPWLIALKGLPGSGKSTLARALSRELGWPLVDKDDIKDALEGYLAATDGPAYDVMLRVARRQLLQGLSVTCDSPFWQTTYRNLQQLAANTDARLAVVECCCSDEELWRRRIEARRDLDLPGFYSTSWEAFQEYRRRYGEEAYVIEEPHLVVDTALALPELVDAVLAWFDQLGIGRAVDHAAP